MNEKTDWSSILSSALRSKLAYQENDTIQSIWKNKSFDNLSSCDDYQEFEKQIILEEFAKLIEPPIYIASMPNTCEKAVAYLWFIDTTAFISIRGTNDKNDALNDANALSIELNNNNSVRVHRGFYKYFVSIQDQITQELTKRPKISRLHIQGHSLGSAASQIACVIYKNLFPKKEIICHTIGCPRTGNSEFVKEFSKSVTQHYRCANEKDPVTMVPMRQIWSHTMDTCFTLLDDGTVKINSQDIPWYWRLFYSLLNIEYLHPIEEHDTSLYTERINKQINASNNQ
jgi:predicted lipase